MTCSLRLCAALLPVLKANPSSRVTGCDISPTALRLLGRAAEQAGVASNRIRTFVLDAASPGGSGSSSGGVGLNDGGSSSSSGDGLNGGGGSSSSLGSSPLAGLDADSCLLVFTLSALAPEDQPALLAHAYAALRPGGLLLFRCAVHLGGACCRRVVGVAVPSLDQRPPARGEHCVMGSHCALLWLVHVHQDSTGCPVAEWVCRDYGLYDMAQLRFPGAQLLDDCLYRRRCALPLRMQTDGARPWGA